MLAIHPNTRTTPAVRTEIAHSQESWHPGKPPQRVYRDYP